MGFDNGGYNYQAHMGKNQQWSSSAQEPRQKGVLYLSPFHGKSVIKRILCPYIFLAFHRK
jgi:hypothetical protein